MKTDMAAFVIALSTLMDPSRRSTNSLQRIKPKPVPFLCRVPIVVTPYIGRYVQLTVLNPSVSSFRLLQVIVPPDALLFYPFRRLFGDGN